MLEELSVALDDIGTRVVERRVGCVRFDREVTGRAETLLNDVERDDEWLATCVMSSRLTVDDITLSVIRIADRSETVLGEDIDSVKVPSLLTFAESDGLVMS